MPGSASPEISGRPWRTRFCLLMAGSDMRFWGYIKNVHGLELKGMHMVTATPKDLMLGIGQPKMYHIHIYIHIYTCVYVYKT